MMRLETVAKDLVTKLRTASPTQQRAASLIACQLALQAAPVEGGIVSETLEQLRRQGVLSQRRIAELNDLAVQLDRKYFDLQDNAEDDPAMQSEALRFFGQARAVSALSFAGGEDALTAAAEAIYEALATVDEGSQIWDAVLLAL